MQQISEESSSSSSKEISSSASSSEDSTVSFNLTLSRTDSLPSSQEVVFKSVQSHLSLDNSDADYQSAQESIL